MTVTHHSNRSVNFASLLSKKSETPLWVLRFMDESPLLNSDRALYVKLPILGIQKSLPLSLAFILSKLCQY